MYIFYNVVMAVKKVLTMMIFITDHLFLNLKD